MCSARVIIILLIVQTCAFAQNPFNKITTAGESDCSDVSNKCAWLFQKYIELGKGDSAKHILKFWKGKCGDKEPIFRATILLSLLDRNYSDNLIDGAVIDHVVNYQNRLKMIAESDYAQYDYYRPHYGYVPIGGEFDRFTKRWASSVMETYPASSLEFLLAEFYGTDPSRLLKEIQSKQYECSVWYNDYYGIVEEYIDLREFHFGLMAGIWIPTGGIKHLGVHPDAGFQFGAKKNKMNYYIT